MEKGPIHSVLFIRYILEKGPIHSVLFIRYILAVHLIQGNRTLKRKTVERETLEQRTLEREITTEWTLEREQLKRTFRVVHMIFDV